MRLRGDGRCWRKADLRRNAGVSQCHRWTSEKGRLKPLDAADLFAKIGGSEKPAKKRFH